MAESPLSLVFLPQYRAISGKWFPNWGYDFQSAWVRSNGMGTEWMPLTGLAHKNLQLNSFLFFNLIFGVEDDGVFISLGVWMTAWITLLFPSPSSPSHCQWGLHELETNLSSCKPLRLESILAREGSITLTNTLSLFLSHFTCYSLCLKYLFPRSNSSYTCGWVMASSHLRSNVNSSDVCSVASVESYFLQPQGL